ncbi:hypothetical protein [Halobacterium jilantaiense]|uniref:Uncharacterized protein n=1 Tax=Halobacterium jilantaiense TaxID=355548 RepID=A0A1I0QPX8_9EURY|nr:hypothetical protein [Halobacterium jilantaiense]SEW29369.1 hypothetical protein SAMN04487945_2822 [Halobacterium jilantaiense]
MNVRDRTRGVLPFLALGVVGWLFDWIRLRDPVPTAVESGFYTGQVDVHLLGFPTGVQVTGLWSGTLYGLRLPSLIEILGLYAALHAVAAVVAGVAYARMLPDAPRPTPAVYARLFVVALLATALVHPLFAVARVEFLLVVAYLFVLVLGVLPTLLLVGPTLVAERASVRDAWRMAEARLHGQRARVLVGLLLVGVAADALVSAPVAGGFLGTAGGGFAYAVLATRAYAT